MRFFAQNNLLNTLVKFVGLTTEHPVLYYIGGAFLVFSPNRPWHLYVLLHSSVFLHQYQL
jgi:hypothetical protein